MLEVGTCVIRVRMEFRFGRLGKSYYSEGHGKGLSCWLQRDCHSYFFFSFNGASKVLIKTFITTPSLQTDGCSDNHE